MKISCKYCGRIHDKKFDCGKKPTRIYKPRAENDRFRWSIEWKRKREEIRERDKNLCQLCLKKIYPLSGYCYTYDKLEVHHIIKIKDRPDLALENSNLITLCQGHHALAENGTIDKKVLREIVREKNTPPRGDIPDFL